MSPEPASAPYDSSMDCTYTISVYPGYGVEIKVRAWGVGMSPTCTALGPVPLLVPTFVP